MRRELGALGRESNSRDFLCGDLEALSGCGAREEGIIEVRLLQELALHFHLVQCPLARHLRHPQLGPTEGFGAELAVPVENRLANVYNTAKRHPRRARIVTVHLQKRGGIERW